MMARSLLFSERYSSILTDQEFAAEFFPELYAKISNCLYEFDEPALEQPSRYDSWTVNTSASVKACIALFERYGWPTDNIGDVDAEWLFRQGYAITFDLIELWCNALSVGEQRDFQERINGIFDDYDQPWRIVTGKLFRIDPAQFERDLQLKHIALLQLCSCSEPVFQSALQEFMAAVEAFNRGEYKTCVLEAEKSYESTLKIICKVASGTAAQLLSAFLLSDYVKDIPTTMNPEGFKNNVLMSLPYIRNNSNVGHGDGNASVLISKELAKLSINLCASLCTYMVELYLSLSEGENSDEQILEDGDLPF